MLDCCEVNRFGLQLAAASIIQVVEGPLSIKSSRIDLRETKFRTHDNDLKHKSSLPGSANLDWAHTNQTILRMAGQYSEQYGEQYHSEIMRFPTLFCMRYRFVWVHSWYPSAHQQNKEWVTPLTSIKLCWCTRRWHKVWKISVPGRRWFTGVHTLKNSFFLF